MPSTLLERLRALPAAGPVLAALGGEPRVWVVGGAVRDLLLDGVPSDLDLVVEGDALVVARRAADRLGGEVLVHERFGTATVRGPDGSFDLAGARRESYPQPGSLPVVELGAPLQDDLERRDFSVNTLALRLADGELLGVPAARADLDARRAARAPRRLLPRRPDAAGPAGALRGPARVRDRARTRPRWRGSRCRSARCGR